NDLLAQVTNRAGVHDEADTDVSVVDVLLEGFGDRVYYNRRWIATALAQFAPRTDPSRYGLYYESGHERIAAAARETLGPAPRLCESHQEDADVDYSIAILSNKTSQAWLDRLLQTTPRLICVVVTSIRIPVTQGDVHRFQWVDDRSDAVGPMLSLGAHLSMK